MKEYYHQNKERILANQRKSYRKKRRKLLKQKKEKVSTVQRIGNKIDYKIMYKTLLTQYLEALETINKLLEND